MNENENGELFELKIVTVTIDDDGNVSSGDDGGVGSTFGTSNMEAVSVADMSEEEQESFWKIQRSLPTVYNYLFNFQNLNIDNEIFYIDRLLNYNNPSAIDESERSPYQAGSHTDGSKYLSLFKVLNTRNLDNNFITTTPEDLDSDALTKQQMTIARHVHYLGDIQYGENNLGYTDEGRATFSIYFPSMRSSAKEVSYTSQEVDGLTWVKANISKEEAEGLASKFGHVTGSVQSHIETKYQNLTTDLFETFISRENIPNVITNNSSLLNINDLNDEGASSISVSAQSTEDIDIDTYT